MISQSAHPWSLRLRLGLILAGITLLALLSMGASVIIAEGARGDAAAINQAGSLRMQSYKIAALLRDSPQAASVESAAERFETILDDAALRRAASGDASVLRRYRDIRDEWRTSLRPALSPNGDSAAPEAGAYLDRVAGFVDSVDAMVLALQEQAERRIQILRITQGGALLLTLLLAGGAMALMHRRIMAPLRQLIDAADRLRQGDFSARADHTVHDEFGVLGQSFNSMAAELNTLYADMEQQVAHKTRDLQRSNDALQLLYDTARSLSPHKLTDATVTPILQRLQALLEAGPISVCLTRPDGDEILERFTTAPDAIPGSTIASGERPPESGAGGGATTIPLRHGRQQHGVLVLERPTDTPLAPWKIQLAEAVADQIAFAQGLAQEAQQQRRLALMEERAVIARELHDSLAQSLSYLKIQVVRLQASMRTGADNADTDAILTELREGLNTAYGHLRELLATFRLKVNEPGLQPALEATIREFRERSEDADIRLDAAVSDLGLDSNAEIHALQIVREALANVVNHAGATRARVSMEKNADNNWIRLRVEDNGIGMPDNPEKAHHYGIQIMTERARSLGGTLQLLPAHPQGTRLEVQFPIHREAVPDDMEPFA